MCWADAVVYVCQDRLKVSRVQQFRTFPLQGDLLGIMGEGGSRLERQKWVQLSFLFCAVLMIA